MRRAPARRRPPYHRPMTPNTPLRSTTRGDVPPEGPLRLGGIDLPAGLHVRPADDDADFDVEAFLLSPGELDGVEDPEIVDYLESIAPIATVRELGGPVAAPPAGSQDLLVPWGGTPGPWRWPSSRPCPRPTP